MDNQRGIATDSGIPWQLPGDSAYFREQTEDGLIIMGWTTYSEFTAPLHDRENYVYSPRSSDLREGFVAVEDLDEFFHAHSADEVWVIGGSAVFVPGIAVADELFITQIFADFKCTKFFPEYQHLFSLAAEGPSRTENKTTYRFERWARTPSTPDA